MRTLGSKWFLCPCVFFCLLVFLLTATAAAEHCAAGIEWGVRDTASGLRVRG